MATQWQIRRGTRAQLDAMTLAEGELAYVTDEDTLYIGSGSTHYLVGRVIMGSTPTDPGVAGEFHVNTTTQKLYYSNGTNWVAINDPSYFLTGGGLEIDADRLDIDWNPSYSTPATVSETTSVDNLTSHLKGIDTAIGGKSDTGHNHDATYSVLAHTHAALYSALDHDASHITGGSDVIDGDKLEVSWSPANYTRTLVTNYSTSTSDLTSHLKGIDTALSSGSVADNSITLAKLDHGTQGDIYYCDTGGAPSRLATGSAGQLLTSGGSGANPSWQGYPTTWYWADISFSAKTVSGASDRYTFLIT